MKLLPFTGVPWTPWLVGVMDEAVGPLTQLNALVIAANTAYILHDDPAVLTQARTAIERVILAATPA